MKSKKLSLLLALLIVMLSSCDIRPVSVGIWDVEIDGPAGIQQSVWTVSDTPALTVSGDTEFEVTEVELAGSRFSWSSATGGQLISSDDSTRVNFNGTVDGGRFAGTLFTQLGNFTVRGTRR